MVANLSCGQLNKGNDFYTSTCFDRNDLIYTIYCFRHTSTVARLDPELFSRIRSSFLGGLCCVFARRKHPAFDCAALTQKIRTSPSSAVYLSV